MAQPGAKPEQQKAAFENVKAPEGKGYYSALSLEFDCTVQDIQKKYKRLALIYHPDKAGASSENVDRFQAVTTAYSVLNHDESRAAYWDMYRIRCYLHQGPPTKGQSLAPFYIFPVKKHDKTGFSSQERLLEINLCEGYIQNWKKDEPHRRTGLDEVQEVKESGKEGFVIKFKGGDGSASHDYRLSADTPELCAAYVGILQAITSPSFVPKKDDEFFPPYSTKKGYVEKRGKSGDWQRRWILLGAGQLLIFRAMDCVKLVNAVPLSQAQPQAVLVGSDGAWDIKTSNRTFNLRNSKASIAQEWVRVFNERVQKSREAGIAEWLGIPGANGVVAAPAPIPFRADDIDEELGRRLSMQLLMDETLEAQEDNDQDSDGETPSAKPSTPGSAKGGASRKRSTLNFNFMRGKGSTKRATSDLSGPSADRATSDLSEVLGERTRDTDGRDGAESAESTSIPERSEEADADADAAAPAPAPDRRPPPIPAGSSSASSVDSSSYGGADSVSADSVPSVPAVPAVPGLTSDMSHGLLSPRARESARKAAQAEKVGRGIAEDFSSRMVRHHL